MSTGRPTPPRLPRIAISYCTQCRWMLRAAWVAQELLTTFSTAIGEIALIPATGGLFSVVLTYETATESGESSPAEVLLWDRKTEGGFPETKVLKQKLRDHIEPDRDLGHSDKKPHVSASTGGAAAEGNTQAVQAGSAQAPQADAAEHAKQENKECEDCK